MRKVSRMKHCFSAAVISRALVMPFGPKRRKKGKGGYQLDASYHNI
jgi:hypothetical protein